MRRTPLVGVGDRFVKVGGFSRVFTVVAISEQPGCPLHAVLSVAPGASVETITLAVSALADPTLFRRL